MSQLHADQNVTLSLIARDVDGNIVSPVPFDAPPTWVNSNEAAATSVVSADGLTVVLTPVKGAVGQVTTVNVSASIGGTVFTASIDETIVAGAVASIEIVETFAPLVPPAPPPPPPGP